MSKNLSPQELLDELLKNASPRKTRSLQIVYEVCKEQEERGSKDFSIPTISRLSKEKGGPSDQTIRNATGSDYRAVMSTWATHTDGTLKKIVKPKQNTVADEILSGISDPTTHALVGVILAENRKLKGEISILKRQTELNIDMRPSNNSLLPTSSESLNHATTLPLLATEIAALQNSISHKVLDREGWTIDGDGRIKNKANRTIFEIGFATAIQKIIDAESHKTEIK